jgi:cytochrome c oxidase subunit 2
MSVERYEKIWMWGAGVLIVLFLSAIGLTAGLHAVRPPSHIETVDPAALDTHPEFGTPAVTVRPDGSVVVTVVASMFSFAPDPIEVPVNRPVTFRLTSSDVIHGFQIVDTNANAMVVPGYVSQFTVTFTRLGEHVITCNEFCGLGHHVMVGKLIVKTEQR